MASGLPVLDAFNCAPYSVGVGQDDDFLKLLPADSAALLGQGLALAKSEATDAFHRRDWAGFALHVGNHNRLRLLMDNFSAVAAWGSELYADALLDAYLAHNATNVCITLDWIRLMFAAAGRESLRAAGDPLPGPGPFELFRGVAGRGRDRRIRGLSWSMSLPVACWFAVRSADMGLQDPAVYRIVVEAADVLAYLQRRNEFEMIVAPPKPKRMRLSLDAMRGEANRRQKNN
jgi:hypothetical protein